MAPPMKMMTIVWSSVPEAILYEILSWLPVKSLFRFRCVSKSWLSIISDPKFTSLHFDHSLAKPKVMLISAHAPSRHGWSYELIFSVDYTEWGIRKCRGQPRSLVADYHGPIPHDWSLYPIRKSVGGLTLTDQYQKTYDTMLICNPSTRESIRFNLPDRHIDHIRDCRNTSYLGFDPVEKNHKVLSSWIHESNPYECLYYVITLGENAWRSVECKYSHAISQFQFYSVDISTHHGFIYYLSRVDEIGSQYTLVGFDVRLETFTSISVPLRVPEKVEPFLTEYGESVAVVYIREKNRIEKDTVIVMAVLIDNEKWECEEYTVPREEVRLVSRYYLVGTSPNGELVFIPDEGSTVKKLECFDLKTKRLKEVKVRISKDQRPKETGNIGYTYYHLCDKVCSHVERLPSLQGLSPAFYHYQRY